MPTHLTHDEMQMFRSIPETDLVDLAIELDIAVPEVISLDELLDQAVVNLAQLARREGLPFSQYDREDLQELSPKERDALASLCGTAKSIDALLKAGQRVYKHYHKTRPKSQVPMVLPMLLKPLARHACKTEATGAA